MRPWLRETSSPATHQLEELSRAHPQDATTLGNLALCYVAGGRAQMAETVYRNAIELAQQTPRSTIQLASLLEDKEGEQACTKRSSTTVRRSLRTIKCGSRAAISGGCM